MATVKGTVSVAAASTSDNVLNNTAFNYIDGPALVTVYASAENYAQMLFNFKIGSWDVVEDGVPNTEQAAGEVNRQNDLVVDRQYIPPGHHLARLRATNSDAANAERFNYLIQIDSPR